MEDPIERLIDEAIQHIIIQDRNPFLTLETAILRLFKTISKRTRVQYHQIEKTVLFSDWHFEILDAYESMKSKMSHEERTSVERVLSKDSPHPAELTKFACAWYKYDQFNACRWFAVDGIIGFHPKAYVQDAFSKNYEKHNAAVRKLYSFYSDPEIIKQIVCKALDMEEEDEEMYASNPDMDGCVGLYAETVGEIEMKRVATERRSKLQSQQQPSKRKKKNLPSTPEPKSPPDSPQDL